MIDWQPISDSNFQLATIVIVIASFIYSLSKFLIRQKDKTTGYRLVFILVHIVINFCLIALILNPSIKTDEPPTATLYVTNNLNLPAELNRNEFVYLSSLHDLERDYLARYKDQIIFNPEQLLIKIPGLEELAIIGDGLSPKELDLFTNQKITYQVKDRLTGVVNPKWNSVLELGMPLSFSATFQSQGNSIYNIQLVNPAQQVEHEIKVIHGDKFELYAQPKLTGKYFYQLLILNQNDKLIQKQLVPIEVKASTAARILILQSAPSFETKQIQNWAAEQASEILIKTRLSKDKFMTRATNLSDKLKAISRNSILTVKLLQYFDLLIIDGRELKSLSNNQLKTLINAIERGLGIIIRADGSLDSLKEDEPLSDLLSNFELVSLKKAIKVDLRRSVHSSKEPFLAESVLLSAEPLFSLSAPNKGLSPLIVTPENYVVSAKKKLGMGSVTLSIIKDSFQLRTADQALPFSRIWSHLVSNTARRAKPNMVAINSSTQLAFQNQKLNICFSQQQSALAPDNNQTLQASIINLQSNDDKIAKQLTLTKDLFFNDRHCGHLWPLSYGWHKVQVQDSENSVYLHRRNSWAAARQYRSMTATKKRSQLSPVVSADIDRYVPINDWVYWWLISVCSSIIWIERKFLSNN